MSRDAQPPASKPRTGLPRAIGALNLLFGGLLLLYGAGVCYTLGPFLARNNPLKLDPVETRQVVEQMRLEMIRDLRARERASTDENARARLRKARQAFGPGSTSAAAGIDFPKVNKGLAWLSRYLWAGMISGPILNALMVASGVGLMVPREWGRRLALRVAALKLVRLAALSALLGAVVVPHMKDAMGQFANTDFGEAFVRGAREQVAADRTFSTPPMALSAREIVRVISACGYLYAVTALSLGAIYPAIVLVTLARATARAACSGSGAGDAADQRGAGLRG